LSPFIEAANQLVTDCCDGAGYASAKLELIERWLAAHFYAIRDPRVADERAGAVSASYMHRVGLHLAQTTYGQQAMLLDTAGGLALLNGRVTAGRAPFVAGVAWAGTKEWGN
jgi:hypothetical protein